MKTTLENEPGKTPLALAEAISAAHRFFQGMKPEHVKLLAEVAMVKQFEQGEIVFEEGDPANRFYLICRGKIELDCKGGDESAPLAQFVGEGEVLVGWSWLFPALLLAFQRARAVEPTTAIFFYGTRLREECDDDPAFGYELMKRVAAIVIKRLQISRVAGVSIATGIESKSHARLNSR